MNREAFIQGFMEKCSEYGISIKDSVYLLEKAGVTDKAAIRLKREQEALIKKDFERSQNKLHSNIGKDFGGGANFVPGKVPAKKINNVPGKLPVKKVDSASVKLPVKKEKAKPVGINGVVKKPEISKQKKITSN